MKARKFAQIIAVATLACGCRTGFQEAHTVSEAENILKNHTWYWRSSKWLQECPPPGFSASKSPGTISLSSGSPVQIDFNELEPRGGLFAFRIAGTLETTDLIQPPLFRFHTAGGYSGPESSITILGFKNGRIFRIDAHGQNSETVFKEAYAVAKHALTNSGK